MPIETIPCPRCGCLPPTEVEAYVEKMLAAADEAHVDLWALEQCRRKLALDEAEYDELVVVGAPTRVRLAELERLIELGVSVLATGFREMALVVDERVEHGRP